MSDDVIDIEHAQRCHCCREPLENDFHQELHELREAVALKTLAPGDPDHDAVCWDCGAQDESVCLDFEGDPSCAYCAQRLLKDMDFGQHDFAESFCAITNPAFPEYDRDEEFRPTREEYDMGSKEAYSPNAFRAMLRHSFTNYDAIIAHLQKGELVDGDIYDAVRLRIHNLIAERLEELNHELQHEIAFVELN